NFFAKQADFPRFKKKGQADSVRSPDPKQLKLDQANSRLFLPKLGWLRYRNSRVKNVTESQSCGKWYGSLQTEPPMPQDGAVGIDSGMTRFATLVDGTFYAPLNCFQRQEASLRKAQQALSCKVKLRKRSALATPAAISCTRARAESTTARRWWVLRTYGCGRYPSWQQA
ncbi:MAG: transposase, partial [Thermosynechococcus sp. Uc]